MEEEGKEEVTTSLRGMVVRATVGVLVLCTRKLRGGVEDGL